eukprot:384215_1
MEYVFSLADSTAAIRNVANSSVGETSSTLWSISGYLSRATESEICEYTNLPTIDRKEKVTVTNESAMIMLYRKICNLQPTSNKYKMVEVITSIIAPSSRFNSRSAYTVQSFSSAMKSRLSHHEMKQSNRQRKTNTTTRKHKK